MLGVVGLEESAETKTEKLSGGQAQRLSIACALVHDPELVFMDEPTGALDPAARRNLWDLLRRINADGRTVVLTTHHMDEAETLCDRVAIMDNGKILKAGPPAALVHNPEVLFLDEPTGALDPQARRNLWDTLRAISAEGRTVVLTTHHMDEAELLCERVAIMDHGKILHTGPPAALIRELDYPSRITVTSGLASPDEARAALPGTEVTDDGVTLAITARGPGPALAWLSGRGALAGLAVRGGTLEDVFLKLTGREYRA